MMRCLHLERRRPVGGSAAATPKPFYSPPRSLKAELREPPSGPSGLQSSGAETRREFG